MKYLELIEASMRVKRGYPDIYYRHANLHDKYSRGATALAQIELRRVFEAESILVGQVKEDLGMMGTGVNGQ